MILQPPLKVGVLDGSVYGSGMSVGPGLMWWEPRPQTAPLSSKLQQDLGPRKVIIYVYKDILGSHLSFRGPHPSNRHAP